jgi:hypothetical protein
MQPFSLRPSTKSANLRRVVIRLEKINPTNFVDHLMLSRSRALLPKISSADVRPDTKTKKVVNDLSFREATWELDESKVRLD